MLLRFLLLSALCSFYAVQAQVNQFSVDLNGTSNYMSADDPANEALDIGANESFTINVWVQTSTYPQNFSTLVSKRSVAGGQHLEGYILGIHSSGVIYFVLEDQAGATSQIYANQNVVDGNWHMITVVRDYGAGVVSVYVDGVLDETVPDATNFSHDNTEKLFVGRWHWYDRFLDGKIDDLSFWQMAMDTSDMNERIICPPTGSEPLLLAYWNFDRGSGQVAQDLASAIPLILHGANWSSQTWAFSCGVSLDENKYEEDWIQVFPNPTTDQLIVMLEPLRYQNAFVELHSTSGEELHSQPLVHGSAVLDLGRFSSGAYLVILRSGTGELIQSRTIIKY